MFLNFISQKNNNFFKDQTKFSICTKKVGERKIK